jgi:hypothetical protein
VYIGHWEALATANRKASNAIGLLENTAPTAGKNRGMSDEITDGTPESIPTYNPCLGRHELFGFLTTDANGIVGPVHPKAMPVLLNAAEEWEVWLRAPRSEAATLQRPLLDSMMSIVATGEKEDRHPG